MSAIVVDLSDPTPPYEQVRRTIVDQVATGLLRPGDRLPSIRALAHDLGLAPGTIARAYKELEEARVLSTRRGGGTRIAEHPPASAVPRGPGVLDLARTAVTAARRAGHADDAILDAVRAALAEPASRPT